jgi:hypothetical protein
MLPRFVLLGEGTTKASRGSPATAKPSREIAEVRHLYQRDQGPFLEVRLTTASGSTVIDGIVDSGASVSVMPRWVAEDLGISEELEPAEPLEGVGGPIDAWSFPGDIQAQAIVDGQDWGAPFNLRPAFADVEAILLGREDFFGAFTVTFDERPDPPYFELVEN